MCHQKKTKEKTKEKYEKIIINSNGADGSTITSTN